jgi:segregation and condensation protein A
MVDVPKEFRPHVDAYRGPIDLLLYLIKKDEVDVFDIPIARIIEQYQIYLELIRHVDPNICGEFLVMAANLMEIKSKLLLPREELGEDENLEDPRLELVRQLLEYKKYKERAMLLERKLQDRNRRYERPLLELEPEDVEGGGPVYIGNVSIWDLFTAFHRVQMNLALREPHRVVMRDRPIEEYIAEIRTILDDSPRKTAKFEDLFVEVRSRHEAIGFFLAILELVKDRMLAIHQEEIFGTIEIRLRDPEEVRLLLEAEKAVQPGVEPAEKFLLEGEGREVAAEPIAESGRLVPTESPSTAGGPSPDERPEPPAKTPQGMNS